MEKLFTFILAIVTCYNVYAIDETRFENIVGTEVVLYLQGQPIREYPIEESRSLMCFPKVINNNGTLIITSEGLIENVHIVITDSTGMAVDNEYVNLSHAGIRVQLPDTDDNEVFKIEIEYGDTYLYGMID
ncbi:hypothetical protein [Xylanibacter caecicola]|uniref:hypothetical protein n=1 Tax=Xylanibacter caecicola TaxID=2736294 RepID=UPI002599BECA|nr:hypothetical protein [Xylanibacter caecicola]